MNLPTLTPVSGLLWAGLIAGILDIAAVFIYWATQGVMPAGILMAIASSLMGPAAFSAGWAAVALGLLLHFLVSFVFAGAYVMAGLRISIMLARPVICGLAYGALAKLIMDYIVVPLSRAEFSAGSPTLAQMLLSWFIHIVLFGLPIALVASRIRR